MSAPNSTSRSARMLFLTKVYPYPPALAGDAVYARGIIEALASSCELDVLCAGSGRTLADAQGIAWHIAGRERAGRAGSVLSRWPLVAWKGATPEHDAALRDLLEQTWDAIVLIDLGSAHALPRVEQYKKKNPHVRLAYVSLEHEYSTRRDKYASYKMSLPKRLVARWDLEKVRRTEDYLITRCDVVTVINSADLEPFRKISAERKYLPLSPGYSGPVVERREILAETPRRVLLLGGRRSEQKRQILLDWMRVSYTRLKDAGIETVIVGDMDDGLRLRLSTDYPAVRVLGFVDNIEELIASARLGIIADTVGGGFKLRLLSHAFQRLPILGLTGAISGLPTTNGEGFLATDTLEALVDLVCETIDDVEVLNRLQSSAFASCASAFSWTPRAQAFFAAVAGREDGVLV